MQNESRVIYVSEDKRRYIQFLEILERYDFQKELAAIRTKWNIDAAKLKDLDDDKVLGEWTVLIEDADLTEKVEGMLAKLEISPVWKSLILSYVLRGDAEVYEEDGTYFTEEPEGAVLQINIGDSSRFTIAAGDKFVLNDLDVVKKILKRTGRFRTARRQDNEYKNWKRDRKIFHMAKAGKNLGEIATAIDNEYGGDIGYGTIKKIVSDWYKRTNTQNLSE